MMLIYQDFEIEQAITEMYKEIMTRNENAMRNESKLEIVNIFYITIMLSRFEPLTASHFRLRPKFLEKKQAILNIQNRDQKCFAYAILSAFHPAKKNPERAKQYQEFYQIEGLNHLDYPVSPDQMPEIEEKLNIR